MNVKLDDDFIGKKETYSLRNIFNNQESRASYYEHGAVGSFFFSAHKYHWYHAPVSGKIVYRGRIGGVIYAINRLNQNKYNKLNNTLLDNWIKYGANHLLQTSTQAFLAHVVTRCIVEIETSSVSLLQVSRPTESSSD